MAKKVTLSLPELPSKNIIVFLIILIIGVIGIIVLKNLYMEKKEKSASEKREIYIGAWVQDFWNNDTKTLSPQKLKDFEKLVDKEMAIAHFYRGWAEIQDEAFINQLKVIDKNGWVPMVSSNPYFYEDCRQEDVPLYAVIAQGRCDTLMRQTARAFKAFNKPVFFRFAWEVNIPTLPWSLEMTKSTTGDYVSAWTRFHQILEEEGATNVIWVFSPNVKSHAEDMSYTAIYPGDNVVDWIALDGYNWGTTQDWSRWSTFDEVYRESYTELTTLAPNKPLMIAEVNSAHIGGDQSVWLADMLGTQIPENFPRVKAVVLFNEDKTQQDGVDWRIEKSHKSIGVLRYVFDQHPHYSSTFTF